MTTKSWQTGSRKTGSLAKMMREPAVLEIAGFGTFRVDKTLIIGRAPGNDIVLNASSVSRHHARILYEAEEYWIEDMDSANGSTVNGKPVRRCVIDDQARITFGEVEAVFRIGAETIEPLSRLSGQQRRSDSAAIPKKLPGRFKSVSEVRTVEEAPHQASQAAVGTSKPPNTGPGIEAGALTDELFNLREENERLRGTVRQLERQLADTNLRLRNLQATLDKDRQR